MLLFKNHSLGNIFQDIENTRRFMDEIFQEKYSCSDIRKCQAGYPPVSMVETNDSVQLFVFAPGILKESINLSLQGPALTLQLERPFPQKDDKKVHLSLERFYGKLSRVFTLPENIDSEKVKASYKDGVLQVEVGKKAPVEPRKIEVVAS